MGSSRDGKPASPDADREHGGEHGDLTPMVVICGPTASGKTGAAIRLARAAGGEIISADSVQLYRGLDIGSAKPTAGQRTAVAHHLLDVVEPDAPMTAARYAEMARQAVAEIRDRGNAVVVVGGTGLYIKALVHGLSAAPGADPEIRKRLLDDETASGSGTLHRRLSEVDPETAARLHPADRVRIVRALEVYELTGTPMSVLQEAHGFPPGPYRVKYVGLDPGREVLNARIEARVHEMIDQGLLDEAEALAARGYGPHLRPLASPGYRQAFAVLAGEMSLEEAIASICTDHRHYARRQRVWFRGVPGIEWYAGHEDFPCKALAVWLREPTGPAKG